MGLFSKSAILGCVLLLAGLGCNKSKPSSILPRKPVPVGTLQFRFIKGVKGPVELTLDGHRIPVTQSKKKNPTNLFVKGLSTGKHLYFLSSPSDSFGPDQGEFEMPGEKGVFIFCFSQRFHSVLYGKPDPIPPMEGNSGITAAME